MKKILVIFFMVIMMVSCEDREPEPILVPEWMHTRLQELEDGGNCIGCTVQRWTYNEEYFYHLYCSYWSCLDCEIYHYDGTPIDWDLIDPVDFNANKHRPVKVWECGDEL